MTKPTMKRKARRISCQVMPEVKQHDQRDGKKRQQEAHIPEEQRGGQEAGVEDDPGARIEALDEGLAFAVTPGDQHSNGQRLVSQRVQEVSEQTGLTHCYQSNHRISLSPGLALDGGVGSHQQRHQDGGEDQVRAGGGQELAHDGGGRADSR